MSPLYVQCLMSTSSLVCGLNRGASGILESNGLILVYGSDYFAETNCYIAEISTDVNRTLSDATSNVKITPLPYKITCASPNLFGTNCGKLLPLSSLTSSVQGHAGHVSFIVSAANGSKYVSGSWDGSLTITDCKLGSIDGRYHPLGHEQSRIVSGTEMPQTSNAIATGHDTVRGGSGAIWDLRRPIRSMNDSAISFETNQGVYCLESVGSHNVAMGFRDGSLGLLDMRAPRQPLRSRSLHGGKDVNFRAAMTAMKVDRHQRLWSSGMDRRVMAIENVDTWVSGGSPTDLSVVFSEFCSGLAVCREKIACVTFNGQVSTIP